MNAADFDYIYNRDGTCTLWDCGQPGVVLAYDSFSPEFGHWFCAQHWPDYEEICIVVEDERARALPIKVITDHPYFLEQLEQDRRAKDGEQ